MKSFTEIYAITDTISSETAFSREESQLLFTILTGLHPRSRVLEIGCQYGRSTSIIMQVASWLKLDVCLVDNFSEPEEAFMECMEVLDGIGTPFTLLKMSSVEAYNRLRRSMEHGSMSFDLIHIDAGHDFSNVYADCEMWLPSCHGDALFHDYNRESLPDVKKAVDLYIRDNPQWGDMVTAGSLACWRLV